MMQSAQLTVAEQFVSDARLPALSELAAVALVNARSATTRTSERVSERARRMVLFVIPLDEVAAAGTWCVAAVPHGYSANAYQTDLACMVMMNAGMFTPSSRPR